MLVTVTFDVTTKDQKKVLEAGLYVDIEITDEEYVNTAVRECHSRRSGLRHRNRYVSATKIGKYCAKSGCRILTGTHKCLIFNFLWPQRVSAKYNLIRIRYNPVQDRVCQQACT